MGQMVNKWEFQWSTASNKRWYQNSSDSAGEQSWQTNWYKAPPDRSPTAHPPPSPSHSPNVPAWNKFWGRALGRRRKLDEGKMLLSRIVELSSLLKFNSWWNSIITFFYAKNKDSFANNWADLVLWFSLGRGPHSPSDLQKLRVQGLGWMDGNIWRNPIYTHLQSLRLLQRSKC